MRNQNYKNHIRYYPPHHFIFLPLTGFLVAFCCYRAFADTANQLLWGLCAIISFLILYLAIMMRQHYALGNQDRIVRLEFRLRYFELVGERSKAVEEKLRFSQIAALRFASDEELPGLIDRAVKENLSADDIKKGIKNWQGDYMRR